MYFVFADGAGKRGSPRQSDRSTSREQKIRWRDGREKKKTVEVRVGEDMRADSQEILRGPSTTQTRQVPRKQDQGCLGNM
ncbi:hypothetical protein HYPSUDRAFT_68206 [Hypholoma sublateritium FD-334 SS-4]|uniref:Uncharacterized protein n=1 Tax=Hypholoma sublateritium (strain FD-334 SS-4) TaxID=945553 RepID=A0A0D2NQ39_HYPSF|nr:hypothetical protein HYPSUDRAFT_68206 [Hypholoma sublateritium FD-334 SS-4]